MPTPPDPESIWPATMASYKRTCQSCGLLINLREMTSGQWVAFEGFDRVHKCDPELQTPSQIGKSTSAKGPAVAKRPLLSSAIADCNLVRFTYVDQNGEESLRTVEPHVILDDHLQAWCRLRNDWRTFRLREIRDLERTSQVFSRRSLDGVRPPVRQRATESRSAPPVSVTKDGSSEGTWIVIAALVFLWIVISNW